MYIRPLRPSDQAEVRRLMADFDLDMPANTELGLGAFEDERLLGCCQLKDGLVQGLAVDSARQGEGLMAALVGELIKRAALLGQSTLGAITRPDAARQFEALGFRLIASAPPYACFLEFGGDGIAAYADDLRRIAAGKPLPRAAIVMNANPFTLGHRHLIERAASENAQLFVLAVQEDVSEFPFRVRLSLIERGTQDLGNVCVVPGGRYVVSSLTFPSYFTKQQHLASAQGALDAAVFASAIAPALGVTRRYVGAEPFSPVTARYNHALRERLPAQGIELIELPRLQAGDMPISASEVRTRLRSGDILGMRALVPESTFAYLCSEEAAPVIERMRGGRT